MARSLLLPHNPPPLQEGKHSLQAVLDNALRRIARPTRLHAIHRVDEEAVRGAAGAEQKRVGLGQKTVTEVHSSWLLRGASPTRRRRRGLPKAIDTGDPKCCCGEHGFGGVARGAKARGRGLRRRECLHAPCQQPQQHACLQGPTLLCPRCPRAACFNPGAAAARGALQLSRPLLRSREEDTESCVDGARRRARALYIIVYSCDE
eukprot:364796-Chlamydomonas_euryale.AAC.11